MAQPFNPNVYSPPAFDPNVYSNPYSQASPSTHQPIGAWVKTISIVGAIACLLVGFLLCAFCRGRSNESKDSEPAAEV